jgi:hypothetical protein
MMCKNFFDLIAKKTCPGQSKRLFLTSSLWSVVFLFVFSAFGCFESPPVNAFHAEVLPHEIKQGDAFIIKLTDVPKSSPAPVANINTERLNFSSCGDACFIALGAIEMKTKPGTYTMNIFVGEQTIPLKLTVQPSNFPTLKLTLPDEKVFLSPGDLKRVRKENKKLQSLFLTASEKLWHGRFILPLEHDFSTVFGIKRIMNEKRVSIHRGLDIRGKMGERVKASNHGKVVLTEELFFGGNTVIIDHGQGIYTIYMHLSAFNVQPGTIVSKGDTIGFVGTSGRATGPHLHFGVKVHNISVNPVSLVELQL